MEKVLDTRYDKRRLIMALAGYALLWILFCAILVLGVSAQVEAVGAEAQDPAVSKATSFDALPAADLQGGNDPGGVGIAARTAVSPGVTIAPIQVNVSEGGITDTYEISLDTEPSGYVIINLATDDQVEVDSTIVFFFGNNWDQVQTITVSAVDDSELEGQHTGTISHTIQSQDEDYGSLDLDDVVATIQDNDGASISVEPTSLTVSEPDGAAGFTIALTSEPASSVTIPLSTSNSECSVSPTSLTLNGDNWSSGVAATVTAVDDTLFDGDQVCVVQTGAATGGDPDYDGFDPADVNVTVEDDEEAEVMVDPTSLTVSEPDGSAAFTMTLTSEPTSSVTIPLTTSNSECSISPASVMLDENNWSTGVAATVTAVDDTLVDGDQVCIAQTGPTASDDPVYHDLNPPDVNVTVQDDDAAGIAVSPTSLTISEPDGSAAFTITLTSEPTSSVTIPLSTSNNECTVAPTSVMLDDNNWTAGVTATVTAIDDAVDDDDQVCMAQTGAASSDDPAYHGLDAADVFVVVQDDESLGQTYLPLMIYGWPPLPEVPMLQPISNSDGNSSYPVRWSTALRAESYVLQEARNSTFSGAVQVYAGPATSYDVTGSSAGRHYYRVKARNSWGDSGWSSPQSVDVVWEAEPNNVPPDVANGPISSNLTYYGTFPNTADINDYYYFDLPLPGSVELWLRNIPTGQNYDLVLYDASLQSSIGYSLNLGNAEEHILTGMLPAARYYVRVYNRGAGTSSQPYHLTIQY